LTLLPYTTLFRSADTADLDVGLLVRAVGDGVVQQIRQTGEEVVELGRDLTETLLRGREPAAEVRDLALQLLGIASGGHRAADRLRALVALAAEPLHFDLDALPFLLERTIALAIEHETAPREIARDRVEILP